MPKGIVIPADPEAPMEVRDFSGLADYQEAVGGLIEPVDLVAPAPATLYVDEEGRLKQANFNARATFIAMVHNPAYLFTGCMFLGDAVLVGAPDDEGETQDLPDEFEQLLLNTSLYKILVQTADDGEAWNGNLSRFEDLHSAYESAIALAHRWLAVERVKVVPA